MSNLLFNGDFDREFRPWRGRAECMVALGWAPWWLEGGDQDPQWKGRQPIFRSLSAEADPTRVRVGASSQRYHTSWGTHVGGLRQQVLAPAGARLRFSAWGQAWSSELDRSRPSQNPTTVHLCVGLDPTGGTDPLAASVVWSALKNPIDRWLEMSVTAAAASEVVTVFMRSSPEFPKKQQHIFWDQALLELLDAPEEPVKPSKEQSVSFGISSAKGQPDDELLVSVFSQVEHQDVGLLVRGAADLFPASGLSPGRVGDAYTWEFTFHPEQPGPHLLILGADGHSRVVAWTVVEAGAELWAEPDEQGAVEQPQAVRAGRQYRRTYVLLPPTADLAWAGAAMRGGFDSRRTVGFSPDDAGVGELSEKRVIVVNPHHWLPELTAEWFSQHYPGVKFYSLLVDSPPELARALRRWRD